MSAATPPALPQAKPVKPLDRLIWLDVLRGSALLGILLVNIHAFRSPMILADILEIKIWSGSLDGNSIALLLNHTFFFGKWATIYSFLFGIGIQMMCHRITSTGASAIPIISRRLGFLLIFGLLHVTFFWAGDILVVYAILGFGVLLLHRTHAKVNAVIAAILITGTFLVFLLLGGLAVIGEMIEPSSNSYDETDWLYRFYQECLTTYATGSWLEIFKLRMINTLITWGLGLFGAPQLLATMLMGSWLVKNENLTSPFRSRKLLIILSLISIPAIALSAVAAALSIGMLQNSILEYLITLPTSVLVYPVISLSYVILVYYAVKRFSSFPIWNWFATAGRMPLTNYLMQSVIATTLFNGYGLGWFGQTEALAAVGIALVIFSFQLIFSHWWLSNHQYGPLEKLWRKLSYRKI